MTRLKRVEENYNPIYLAVLHVKLNESVCFFVQQLNENIQNSKIDSLRYFYIK